jgi:Tol biopolymer transport system component
MRPMAPANTAVAPARDEKRASWKFALWLLLISAFSAGTIIVFFHHRPTPPGPQSTLAIISRTEVTHDGLAKNNVLSDGSKLYVTELVGGHHVITQVDLHGGATSVFPTSFTNIEAVDVSPDRSILLASPVLGGTSDYEFWKFPLHGGAPQQVGNITGRDASWGPDGKHLVFAKGQALYVANSDGTQVDNLVTTAGTPFAPRFSPDGRRIRFSVSDAAQNTTSLWEVRSDGSNPHALLPGWNSRSAQCCGMWTADGRYYLFQVSQTSPTNVTTLWALREPANGAAGQVDKPVQLTWGPFSFGNVWVAPKNSKEIWALGVRPEGELVKYESSSQQFVPLLSGISATDLDFSRDDQWVTYVSVPKGILWRSRVDGSDRKQLTFPPERAALPRWSPDGQQIAYVTVQTGKPYRILTVSRNGGAPQELLAENRSQIDANWSPDGSQVMFGYVYTGEGISIKMLDLKSHHLSTVPGSEGLFSPRWSPNGRYIAALSPTFTKLMLFDFRRAKWSEWLTEPAGAFSYPVWSSDSKYIYFDDLVTEEESIRRVKVGEHHPERVFVLKDIERYPGPFGLWSGRTPDGSWVFVRDRSTQEVYSLKLQ